jgi:hypothetical protein
MCQEKSRKLMVEVFDGKEYVRIYQGELLFGAEPNDLPLMLPYKYPQKIERIKITSQISEYFHLSKVNVLAAIDIKEKEKLKIKVGILGTSNSIMGDGYTIGLRSNLNIIIQRNASIGSSQAVLIPYILSQHDFKDCDVVMLDILVNEQIALWHYDYDISLSSQIFDYFLSVCISSNVLPIILFMPEIHGYGSPQHLKFQQMRRHYLKLCNERGIPYFDGYAYAENSWTKDKFNNLFKDSAHINSIYAQNIGSALAKAITTIHSSHKIINDNMDIYDFKYIDIANNNTQIIIERKTSIVESKFLKLSKDETCDVNIGEYEIVGIAFNMAQSNGILEFKGENTSYKMLSNSLFDPNRPLWFVVWSLIKPIKADVNGKVALKCLEVSDIPNVELHDHGKADMKKYANEPVRLEIQGFVLRSKNKHHAVGMRMGINLDMERY